MNDRTAEILLYTALAAFMAQYAFAAVVIGITVVSMLATFGMVIQLIMFAGRLLPERFQYHWMYRGRLW